MTLRHYVHSRPSTQEHVRKLAGNLFG